MSDRQDSGFGQDPAANTGDDDVIDAELVESAEVVDEPDEPVEAYTVEVVGVEHLDVRRTGARPTADSTDESPDDVSARKARALQDRATAAAADSTEGDAAAEWGDEEDVDPRRRVTVKDVATGTGRALRGLGALAAAAAVGAVLVLVPFPTAATVTPGEFTVVPASSPQTLTCQGGLLRLSDGTGLAASQPTSLGTASVMIAGADPSLAPTPIAMPIVEASAPTTLTGPADAAIAASAAQRVATADFAGAAAAACQSASLDTWLVGGATTLGTTTLLTLTNPSDAAASVDLELFGTLGPIPAPGITGITVEPGGQHVVSLAGFAIDQAAPVVHVTATGGQVVAALEQSTIRGLQPGGIDYVTGAVAPGTDLVIPGIRALNQPEVGALVAANDQYRDLLPAIRVLAPTGLSEGPVAVSIEITHPDGQVTESTQTLEPGIVTELGLGDLQDGATSVRITAPTPVVGAVRTGTAAGAADYAWFAPTPALADVAHVAIPNLPGPVLGITNPTADDRTVIGVWSGAEHEIVVPAGGTEAVSVPRDAAVELTGAEGLHAAVSLAGDGVLATVPVLAPPGAHAAVTVIPSP